MALTCITTITGVSREYDYLLLDEGLFDIVYEIINTVVDPTTKRDVTNVFF